MYRKFGSGGHERIKDRDECMRVIKILNNSLLLTKDEQGQEMIVMGKGLAFKGKVGERLDEEHIQKRFILQNNPSAQAYVRTIENMPEKHVNVINKLITNAKKSCLLTIKSSSRLWITCHLPLNDGKKV